MSQSELNFTVKCSNFDYRQIDSIANLLVNKELIDCNLIVEDKTIPAHRLILSASSEYFRKLFSDPSSNDEFYGSVNCTFRNFEYKDIFNVVKFIYTGKLKLSQEDLVSFINTGKFFEVKGIKDLEIDIADQQPKSILKSNESSKQSNKTQVEIQSKKKQGNKRSSEMNISNVVTSKRMRRNTIHFGRAELALLEQEEDDDDGKSACNFCFRKFLNVNTAKNHIRFCEKNPDRKICRCPICNEIVKPGSMTYHKKVQHGHIPVSRTQREKTKTTVSSAEI